MKRVYIFFLLLASLYYLPVSGQNKAVSNNQEGIKEDTLRKDFYVFGSDDIMDVSIRFDLTSYLRKNLKGGALNGVMTFWPGRKDSLSKNIVIRTRGAFRFKICSFAPMEINFRRSLNAYPDSGKVKKLKLVTHCQPGPKYDEYLLREYLVYKLYSVLTDTSYRVRLLRVSYIDTQKKRKTLTQFGFFIEPKSIMAARTHSAVVDAMNLNQNHIYPEVMDRVAIFNYMVGDWDWAVNSLHNITVLKPMVYDPSGLALAVPFDFDLTGVVDPDYNLPPPESGLTSNRDRLYMGVCREKETYRKDLVEFAAKKENFFKVINEFPSINERAKKDIINYLDGFFDHLGRQKDIDGLIAIFINNCKKI